MIGLCLERRQPFGVVLIKEGVEAQGPLAEPHLVGCSARITQVERLGQGRMNIEIVGRRRFRILSINRDLPYLVGKTVYYPLQDDAPGTETAARRLRPWVVRYMDELSQIENSEFDPQPPSRELATGVALAQAQYSGPYSQPIPFAFMAAALLRIPADQKQSLLAAVAADELLNSLRWHYRREVAFLKAMVEQRVVDQGPFSMN